MRGFFSVLCSLLVLSVFGQIPTYYNNVNLTLTGMALKAELSNKIITTHTNELDYGDVWVALKQTDLDPTNSNNVLLLYGYNDTDGSIINDRTRDKSLNGGNVGEWNREHTYAKSLANPSMDTDNPSAGTDAHHLRATDVQMNNNRGSRLFAAGSGNAGNVGAYWYPGDEWKGDVARMMMYMYLRYPSISTADTECLPNDVGVGTSVTIDPDMIELFLDWNAEDTVSTYEKNRNTILQGIQGNRNPFIDNPYLATIIWGGTVAQDKWNMTTTIRENDSSNNFRVYPNPSSDYVKVMFNEPATSADELLVVYTINGKKFTQYTDEQMSNNEVVVKDLPQGIYIFKYQTNNSTTTKKVVIN
jgi:endonuclease I